MAKKSRTGAESRTAGTPANQPDKAANRVDNAASQAATRVDLPAASDLPSPESVPSSPENRTVLLDVVAMPKSEQATQLLDVVSAAAAAQTPKPVPATKNAAAKNAAPKIPPAKNAAKTADAFASRTDEPLTGPFGLDVRMLWRGDTHAAKFFARPVSVTLGEDGTFALPPEAMGKKEHELTVLVEPQATVGFALRVDNPAATGHVLVDGKSYELAAIRAGTEALKGPAIPITTHTHAYVEFGDFTFLVSRAAIPPPPPLSLWDRENTIFLLCVLLALAFLGGPLWAGFNSAEFRNRARLSYLDQVEQDLRKPEMIEVLVEQKPEEVKPVEKAEENKPSEAPPIQAPPEKKEEKKAEQLKDQLKDLNEEERKAKVTDIVRDEMAKNTAQIDDALKDVGGPTTKLFAEDDGSGGPTAGATADASDLAAGALGGPNGRHGAGDGSETGKQVAAGLGKDSSLGGKDPNLDVHERKQNLVRVGGSVGDTTGELPKAVIKAYIATKMGAIKACYQKGLQGNPDLSGKIRVKFLIQPNGAVNPAKIDESTIGNDNVENCVLNNVKVWKFPQAKGGGVTTVVYPFIFASH